jgi:glycosyltransferase involved in cell wall biosynthesis
MQLVVPRLAKVLERIAPRRFDLERMRPARDGTRHCDRPGNVLRHANDSHAPYGTLRRALAQTHVALEPSTPLISIIVPVFNEARTVAEVIERLIAIELPAAREILVVNDGSTDGTRDVLDQIRTRPEIRIIHADKNGGKGSAIRIGFARATGTIVAIQDADLELDPAQIAELVEPILDGRTRVVYGSRFLAGRPAAPWLSIFANQVLTGVTNLLFGGRITDMETCYKVMEREVAQSLNLESNRFDIEPEITAKLLRAGHSILELPIRFEPRSRAQGKKIGWRDGVRAIQVLVKYRFSK